MIKKLLYIARNLLRVYVYSQRYLLIQQMSSPVSMFTHPQNM